MAELVVRGALIVDGTGGPPFEGDIAVDGGRILQVGGRFGGETSEEVDGRGLAVCPGFIDPHTHLDAALFWDPTLSPTSAYGVTTVVVANCGYALAPAATPEARDAVLETLASVEQIPVDAIRAGVAFDWTDMASYAKRLDRTPTLLNHVHLAGHVALRIAAMGVDAARSRPASPDERRRLCDLLADALRLGAAGFSTDCVPESVGPSGSKLPGQVCDEAELLDVARTLGRGPGPGLFAMAPAALLAGRAEREADLDWHTRLHAASGRDVVVGPVFDAPDDPGVGVALLDAHARTPGVVPQVLPRPFTLWGRLDEPSFLVRVLPSLRHALRDGGAESIRALAADEIARRRLRAEAAHVTPSSLWNGSWTSVSLRLTDRADARDRPLAQVAASDGVDPIDVLVDTAVREDFATRYVVAVRNPDDAILAQMVSHAAATIGASDAGAHTLSNTDACVPVWLLQHWVRETQTLTVERAVHLLTLDPARRWGLLDRGRLAPGLVADLTLIDPDRVGVGPVREVADLPGGSRRLVAPAVGVRMTVVGGVVATRDGVPTAARPGRRLVTARAPTR